MARLPPLNALIVPLILLFSTPLATAQFVIVRNNDGARDSEVGVTFVASGQQQQQVPIDEEDGIRASHKSRVEELLSSDTDYVPTKKDWEQICNLLQAVSKDALGWLAKRTAAEYKKQGFWFLQNLKKRGFVEGIVKVARDNVEAVFDVVVNTEVYMQWFLDEQVIEVAKEDPAKFREDLFSVAEEVFSSIEDALSEMEEDFQNMIKKGREHPIIDALSNDADSENFDSNLNNLNITLADLLRVGLDRTIEEIAGTDPEDLVAMVRKVFTKMGIIANDVRDLDPQDPNFEMKIFKSILFHAMSPRLFGRISQELPRLLASKVGLGDEYSALSNILDGINDAEKSDLGGEILADENDGEYELSALGVILAKSDALEGEELEG